MSTFKMSPSSSTMTNTKIPYNASISMSNNTSITLDKIDKGEWWVITFYNKTLTFFKGIQLRQLLMIRNFSIALHWLTWYTFYFITLVIWLGVVAMHWVKFIIWQTIRQNKERQCRFRFILPTPKIYNLINSPYFLPL